MSNHTEDGGMRGTDGWGDDGSGDDGSGDDGSGSGGGSGGGGALDGSGLVRAFERAKDRALASSTPGESPRERTEWVLEATAYVAALEIIGRLSSIERVDREALAAKTRRTLLSLAGLAADEDDRDALELAARYAREGLRALTGTADEARTVGDEPPPPVWDLVRFVRGELDGLASADVALRLRGSARGRAELARMVPSIVSPAASRYRVAADSLPVDSLAGLRMRDPREGRAVGSLSTDDGAFEAFAFEGGVLAIYADPPLSLRVTGAGVEALGASPGYVELRVLLTEAVEGPLTLRVEHGDRAFDWPLSVDGAFSLA